MSALQARQIHNSLTLTAQQITRCATEKESAEAETTMQDTIKQNRQLWMSLKQENKQYKKQLMQRRDGCSLKSTAAEEQVQGWMLLICLYICNGHLAGKPYLWALFTATSMTCGFYNHTHTGCQKYKHIGEEGA